MSDAAQAVSAEHLNLQVLKPPAIVKRRIPAHPTKKVRNATPHGGETTYQSRQG